MNYFLLKEIKDDFDIETVKVQFLFSTYLPDKVVRKLMIDVKDVLKNKQKRSKFFVLNNDDITALSILKNSNSLEFYKYVKDIYFKKAFYINKKSFKKTIKQSIKSLEILMDD